MNKGGVSPKLKATMKKIENILRKEDIAGNIILGDGHGNFEYRVHYTEPSWSMLRWIQDKKAMHLKVHAKSKPTETNMTINIISGFLDLNMMISKFNMDLMERVESVVTVEKSEPEHTPGE